MKLPTIVASISTLIFGTLYFIESSRTEELRSVIEQRNRAFVTLSAVANGLANLSNTATDSLLLEISTSTEILTNTSTSYIIGTTLNNPENYTWDYDILELKSDSTGQLQSVELFKQ